jgi:hypothetical protein
LPISSPSRRWPVEIIAFTSFILQIVMLSDKSPIEFSS